MILGITYAGLALAGWFGSRGEDVASAARGGWCAAAASVAVALVGGGWAHAVVVPAVAWALAPASWAFVATLSPRWLLVAVFLCAGGGALRGGEWEAIGNAGAVVAGVAVARAMRDQRQTTLRLVAYTASFYGTFAGILPLLVSTRTPTPIAPAWIAVLVTAALALGVAGTLGLARAGGTPEPFDPPPRLCINGIYRWIRHPIQLAEVCAVCAGALAVGSANALVYAAGFALALFGPIRWREERILVARHGAAYTEYAAQVPAWLPKVRPFWVGRLAEE